MSGRNRIRRHYVFHGDVQGVGFRWYARNGALASGASGWVRNEWDGSVHMELQGYPEQIDSVIELLRKDTYIRIDRIDVREIPLDGAETGFQVRF